MDDNQRMLLGPSGKIKKRELVRAMMQSLKNLGYEDSARILEIESNISYNTLESTSLKSQIVGGNWDESAKTLCNMNDLDQETRSEALMRVLRMWMLECLNREENSLFLKVLQRNDYVFGMEKAHMDKLACSLIHYKDEIPFDASCIPELRQKLVAELESLLSPATRLPRLESLVESAVCAQRNYCRYHNSADTVSLYEDHSCGREQFPTETVQILWDHKDEVWFVKFSNNGKYLASSSRDGKVIIWEVPECGDLTLKHILDGHETSVSFLSWSPSDLILLTCGHEEDLKVWDVNTGRIWFTYCDFSPILSSCAWLPGENGLFCGRSRPRSFIHLLKFGERTITTWSDNKNCMIVDFDTTPDGKYLVAIFSENHIMIKNIEMGSMGNERVITEESAIVSVSVSEDGKFLIVNLSNQEIHVWDVEGKMIQPLKYRGHKQVRFVIHSCFGGFESRFIASGSEDSRVYIWNRRDGIPLEVLNGHSMTVNCVSWNPKRPQMLASASDDGTVRIWGPELTSESV
ncbi:hypothetical protein F0562_025649 [Nyssa sinensis]|uniref:CTLH domain-containing protein n=1 Tax=Nyssa sinensis TaxID=561372 RepID=A0A5J5BB21_9ASTE|nr:hypothetical protein F0562_025649 [Nyssa sinensis]